MFQVRLIRRILGRSKVGEPGACPYCNAQIDPSPTRNRLCPSCGATIYVRRGNRQLFTEEQSLKLDASPEAVLKLRQDPTWQKLDSNLKKAIKKSDLELVQKRCYQMSIYLHQHGRDNYQAALESRIAYLQSLQELGFSARLAVRTTGTTACGECRAVAGKILTIEQALESAPIPVKVCSNMRNVNAPQGFCDCYYEMMHY